METLKDFFQQNEAILLPHVIAESLNSRHEEFGVRALPQELAQERKGIITCNLAKTE